MRKARNETAGTERAQLTSLSDSAGWSRKHKIKLRPGFQGGGSLAPKACGQAVASLPGFLPSCVPQRSDSLQAPPPPKFVNFLRLVTANVTGGLLKNPCNMRFVTV